MLLVQGIRSNTRREREARSRPLQRDAQGDQAVVTLELTEGEVRALRDSVGLEEEGT